MSNEPSLIKESEVSIPVLLALAQASEHNLPGLTTTQIRSLVVKALTPSQQDQKVLANGEIRIDRLVRNAISSHKSMEKSGYVTTRDGMTSITLKGQQRLAGFLVALMSHQASSDEVSVPAQLPDPPGIKEGELIAPALVEMAKAHINGCGPLSTAKLIAGITANLPMGKHDSASLKSGGSRGERIIRNLRSHRSLVNRGLATIETVDSGPTPGGKAQKTEGFAITDKGWQYLLSAYLLWLPSPDFATLPERSPPGMKGKIQAKFKAQRQAVASSASESADEQPAPAVPAPAPATHAGPKF